jgi:hypothetical protein
VTGRAASTAETAPPSLSRRGRDTLGAAAVVLAALAGLGALLLAPNRLAHIRLGGPSLAWWAGGALGVLALAMLARAPRGRRRDPARAGGATALGLAAVWGSPALWLGLPPLLLAEGPGGLWAAAAIAAGVGVAGLVVGDGPSGSPASLAARRWPDSRGPAAVLVVGELGVATLFAAAQLAAAREIGTMLGWSRLAVLAVGAAVVAGALFPAGPRLRLAALGGGAALLGLGLPLAGATLATGPTWLGAWTAVASRPRLAFSEESAWTTEGRAVRGPGHRVVLAFSEAQQITFASPGRILLDSRAAADIARDVRAGERLSVHPGDRLTVAGGMRIRFQAGRRIPGGPDSGPEWAEGPAGAVPWTTVVGLGVTVVLGMLGLAPAASPGAVSVGVRGAAGLVLAGVALVVAWTLWAAWLRPEIYAGGVSGAEVFETVPEAAAVAVGGGALGWVVLAGLVVGAAGAVLGGSAGAPAAATGDRRVAPLVAGGVLGLGLALAVAAPATPWTLLLAALGLAGATRAPAALAIAWSGRATARGVAAGAGVGLVTFGGLCLGTLLGVPGPGALGALAAWPAALAAPAHALVVWALATRRVPGRPARLPASAGDAGRPVPAMRPAR